MRRRVRPVSIPNEQFTYHPSWGDRNRLCSAVAVPPGTSKADPIAFWPSSAGMMLICISRAAQQQLLTLDS
jgi:hypothetical protein